jgi:membrane-associated phospholipid phosphatase
LRQKVVLSFVLTIGIWTTYLALQRHPVFPATAMQPTWIDRSVPFLPGAVYLCESIWLLMPIAPWLVDSKAELNRYAVGLVLIALASFAVFFFHPTLVVRPSDLPVGNGLYGVLTRIDGEQNAFPSLHCAFAVFHGACCYTVFSDFLWRREIRWFIWVWVLGIVASTPFTKQHVLLDAVAGIMVGLGGFFLCCRLNKAHQSGESES